RSRYTLHLFRLWPQQWGLFFGSQKGQFWPKSEGRATCHVPTLWINSSGEAMKNTFKKLLQGIALISATATLPTVQAFDTRLLDEVRKLKIEKLVDIPIQSLKAVESNGEIHYISNNGRFILQGRLVDVLQQKPLDTMPQIAFATQKLT